VFLRNISRKNGYAERQIRGALNHPPKVVQPDEKPDSVAFLPFVGSIFKRISRVLSRYNTKSVGLPPTKISSFLRSVRNDRGLKTPGVYNIPCEYGQVYIGQTGH
jgi:hypothetical protein